MIVNDGGSNFNGYFTFLYINLLQNLTSLTNYLFRQGNSEAGPLFVWGLEEDCTIRHGIDFSVISTPVIMCLKWDLHTAVIMMQPKWM
jgi:hypothetical protein